MADVLEQFENSRSNDLNGRHWRWVTYCLCLVSTWCLGCGSSTDRGYIHHDEELFPVSGQVLFEGKPASNASITFHRTESGPAVETESGEEGAPLNPRGTCDKAGKFQLFTYALGDGAPAGDFVVTVSWQDPENRGRDDNYPELLPKRYQDPKTSGLKVQLKQGHNVLPAFELKR